jgi:hypothetical protein
MDSADRKTAPEVDREGLKLRLRTIVEQPGENEAAQAGLVRQLVEVCPDETLLLELLREIDRERTRAFGDTVLGLLMSMKRALLNLPELRLTQDVKKLS